MKKAINFIALLAIVLVAFSCKKETEENSSEKGHSSIPQETVTEEKQDSLVVESKSQRETFDYTPQKPVDGTLKAVVELGAQGFNYFVVNIDKNKNWEVKQKDFGNSMVLENMATEKDILTGLKDYIQKILDIDGIKGKDIHFVVSSGASKEEKVKQIAKSLKKIGYVVNEVTPEKEAYYGYMCVVPKEFRDNSFVLDIGSGNTKIGYEKNGSFEAVESYGAKYYKKDITDDTVYNDVEEKLNQIPTEVAKRCFILGGVPFNLASKDRVGEERYTVLSKDITQYKSVEEDKGEKVHCGLNIYNAVVKTKNVEQVIFDWNANFTIGFLLSLNN